MQCKNCENFVQRKGRSGACRIKPYVTTRSGKISKINGVPRELIVFWSSTACKMYKKGESDDTVKGF